MTSPAYSVIFSAQVSGTASSGGAGDPLIPASAGGLYVLSTSAARGTRRTTGIALGPYGPTQPVEIQQSGLVDYDTFNLGAGTASWVRVSAAGALERCTPTTGDDIVGRCDTSGALTLMCGLVTPAMANAVAPAGTANTVQTSDGAGGLTGATAVKAGSYTLSIGTVLPTVGNVQLQAGASVYYRNSGDTTNYCAMVSNDTILNIAQSNTSTTQFPTLQMFPATTLDAGVSTTTHLRINATTGLTAYQGYITVASGGTGAATTGAVRLVNNSGIYARNQAGTANIQLLTTDASNVVQLGDTTNAVMVYVRSATSASIESGTTYFRSADGLTTYGYFSSAGMTTPYYVTIGVTNMASTGSVRLTSTGSLAARNNANNNDAYVFQLSTDVLYFCTSSAYDKQIDQIRMYTASGGAAGQGSTNYFGWGNIGAGTGNMAIYVPCFFGSISAAAQSGAIRLENAAYIKGRNAANSADIALARVNASNVVEVGDATSAGVTLFGAAKVAGVLSGDSGSTTPLKLKSSAITQSSTADTTLTAAQYECPILNVSGTPGGNFNIIAPNTSDAIFFVRNNTANTLTIKKTGGTGIAIATTKAAMVWHNGTDYVRLTPDA